MLVADGNGLPIGILCDSAQPHEISLASRTLASVAIKKQKRGRARTRMQELIADKGFDSAAFRRNLTARGIKTCIPTRKYKHRWKRGQPPRFSAASYAERWRVERCFAWFDSCRRLVVRYERGLHRYKAFCVLGCILLCVNRILK
jgi:transposase